MSSHYDEKNDRPSGKSDKTYPLAEKLKKKICQSACQSLPENISHSEYVAISKKKFKALQEKNANKF